MQDERFTIKYISVNTCFVYLPEHWLRKLSSHPNVVKVLHNDVNYYLSWYTRPSPDNSKLCLSATFARTLNIKEGDEVFVSCTEEAPPLTSLVVAPKSSHDREIVEMQSENIQTNLLDQIAIVAKNQTIVAWVSKYLSVTLIVKSLNPHFKYGRLQDLTEIHVSDVPAYSTVDAVASVKPEKEIPYIFENLSKYAAIVEPASTYRVHLLPKLCSTTFVAKSAADEALRSPFRIFIQQTKQEIVNNGKPVMCKIRKVREDRQHKTAGTKFTRGLDIIREFTVLISSLENILHHFDSSEYDFTTFTRHPSVFMFSDLMDNLHVKVGGKVILEMISHPSDAENVKCKSIEIMTNETFINENIFRNYVSRNARYEKMLLNSHGMITFEDGMRCAIKMLPEECTYGFFDETSIKKINVRIVETTNVEERQSIDKLAIDVDVAIKSVALNILNTLIVECNCTLLLSLGLHNLGDFEYNRENILIAGSTGSGKTTVCKLLYEKLRKPPYYTYASFIDCRSLKGKKVEVIKKLLTTEISHAVYYQPSILFFDDIESITSANLNTEETTPDSTNAARITDTIFKVVTEYQSSNYISVVATCTDITKVGKKLREARGDHFFRTILTIPNLEKEERIEILRSSLQDKLYLMKEIDWDYYGNKTEGWVAQDLVVLADKAAFAAWKRHVKDGSQGSLMLSDSDLSETLSRCTPVSLHGVNLYRGAGLSWSDIGGLADVKNALVEILHWPLKYPEIFKKAPIKLQSGILLYGMPGTGKTMLAGAIAKECGLNLISVKGPELLSKYIGASEEAVRNVFEKAQRAKPCVLFFDEFDSLAPRRGHDSTGVTDRVVNQLLTHLDGIEGRDGVAVVAASSRPDLLDPALLRPGRFDKSLLCPLPHQIDREEILSTLCRTHEIDTSDLDLKAIADLTSGYTGADLNAILMQARLDVIEKALDTVFLQNQQNVNSKNVTQEALLESVKSTKPSLSPMEKKKYSRIYAKFTKSESNPMDDLRHQKATLA